MAIVSSRPFLIPNWSGATKAPPREFLPKGAGLEVKHPPGLQQAGEAEGSALGAAAGEGA